MASDIKYYTLIKLRQSVLFKKFWKFSIGRYINMLKNIEMNLDVNKRRTISLTLNSARFTKIICVFIKDL